MRKKNKKPIRRKTVLRLPDLDHANSSVVNSLSSRRSRRNYKFAMQQFITWYCSEPRLALNRIVVLRFRLYPGVARIGRRHHQLEACRSQTTGVRGCGFWALETGIGRRNTSC
jgi:hypothetical protein